MASPLRVKCPYCQQEARPLRGPLGETKVDRTRYGCDNAHYFVYPERLGYAPVVAMN